LFFLNKNNKPPLISTLLAGKFFRIQAFQILFLGTPLSKTWTLTKLDWINTCKALRILPGPFYDLRKGFMSFFFFLPDWGLNSGPTPWATPPVLFFDVFFWDRVSWTICPGWLRIAILLISASWIARIIGVSHQHLAHLKKIFLLLLYWGYTVKFTKVRSVCLSYYYYCLLLFQYAICISL
jgi:hypothetical protein